MERKKPTKNAEHTPVAKTLHGAISPSLVVLPSCPHSEELARIRERHPDAQWALYEDNVVVTTNFDKIHSAQRELARIMWREDQTDPVAAAQVLFEHFFPKKASLGDRARQALLSGFTAGSQWVDNLHFGPELRRKALSKVAGFVFSKLMPKEDAELEATDFVSALEDQLRLARRLSPTPRLLKYARIWLSIPRALVTGIIEHRRYRLSSQNGREQ